MAIKLIGVRVSMDGGALVADLSWLEGHISDGWRIAACVATNFGLIYTIVRD